MAIFRVITLLIHAIVAAIASMLTAVFTHLLPMVLVVVLGLGTVAVVCASFGIGGVAFLRRRRKDRR